MSACKFFFHPPLAANVMSTGEGQSFHQEVIGPLFRLFLIRMKSCSSLTRSSLGMAAQARGSPAISLTASWWPLRRLLASLLKHETAWPRPHVEPQRLLQKARHDRGFLLKRFAQNLNHSFAQNAAQSSYVARVSPFAARSG